MPRLLQKQHELLWFMHAEKQNESKITFGLGVYKNEMKYDNNA